MRLGFAVLLAFRLPSSLPARQPTPNGLAHWLDLTWLGQAANLEPLRWVFFGMLILYVSGRCMALALPILFAVHLGVFTLGNSQGWIGHTDQIVTLILLVQTIFHFGHLARRSSGTLNEHTVGDLEIFYTQQTIAATYVVAALTKLIKTGGSWITQLPNITVQIVKTNDQFYYDSLAHPNPGFAEWLNGMIIHHPWIAYPLFAPGLIIELAAFIIVYGRRPAIVMGLVLVGMHALIILVMQITFSTNIALIVIYLLNVPWLLAMALRRRTSAIPDGGK